MDAVSVKEILNATGGELLSGSEDMDITGICQDSREYKPGEMFVAIVGEQVDGHKFLEGVREKGCEVFLVSDRDAGSKLSDATVVLVEDSVAALRPLTRYYLQERLNVGRISVTGSVGKTSTRDMVYNILSQKYRTGRPIKNYNSDVGLPLTVASFGSDLEMAVLEQGAAGHFGDIHRLSDMARPQVAIITNIGISHMEFFGSREGILKTKMEIADFFDESGVLVVNSDNDLLQKEDLIAKFHPNYTILTVGTKGGEDYHISNVQDLGVKGTSFTLTTETESRDFVLKVPGAHNCLNASLAIAACQRFGLTWEQAQAGLDNLELTGKRLKLREGNGVSVLDDSYNAAPDSVKAAITVLEHTPCERRIAILGPMNELGDETPKFHYEVGEFAAEHGVDILIGIEEKCKDMVEGAKAKGCEALYYDTKEDLYPDLDKLIEKGDLVLTKASMTRHFWEIADRIINE